MCVCVCVCVCHNMDSEELSHYMEDLGASSPGVMTLTTYLSRPFQQIERYSLLLKELERHSEVEFTLLPTALAREVMQLPPSVCPSVHLFPLYRRNQLQLTLNFCV